MKYNNKNTLFLIIFILFGISISTTIAAETSNDISYFVNIENNGKSNRIELEYFNNSRYIDIEKIPNNIISKSKYYPQNYSITSEDIKLQFLPGSFYYTVDNIEETKVIQMYMPTISRNNAKNAKSKLFVPFVSFMKSLDSAGLYDVSYENNKSGDIVRIKSKNTKNTFLVSFPKLNFIDNELGEKLEDNPESIDSEFKEIDEDYWDSERIANLYAEGNDLEHDLSDNELAESISDIANKVFNSIKSIDKNYKNNVVSNTSSASGGSGSGSRISRIMPRYNGPFIRRKSYTDPFPKMKITTENDNLKFKVSTADNDKKEAKPKKVKTKTKEVLEDKGIVKGIDKEHNIEISNSSAAKSENKLENKTEMKSDNKQPKTNNSDYYLPQNLKRPGIDF